MLDNLKRASREEGIALCVLLLFDLYITFSALRFPDEAKLFPVTLGICGTVFCLLEIFVNYYPKRTRGVAEKQVLEPNKKRRLLLAYTLSPAYLLMVYLVGFLLGTFFMGIVASYLLGEKRRLTSLFGFNAGLVLVIWTIFHVVLEINFPTGLLGVI